LTVGRYVVLEKATLAQARGVAAGLGSCVVEGWDAPARPSAVRVGAVTDLASAARAVLAAVRGADLVVVACAERAITDQLCDDLRRLGQLEHRLEQSPSTAELSPEERALLAHLVGGASLGEAARALHISRRTADRRLAAARKALGAASTSEAVVLARRRGIAPG
jgi:DNA-binding NarL/FixJ family response regulator